jgi:hypothetical protein
MSTRIRLALLALFSALLVLACTTPGWDDGRGDDDTFPDDDDTVVDDDDTVVDDDDDVVVDDDDDVIVDDDDSVDDDDVVVVDDDDAVDDDDDVVPGDSDGDGFAAIDQGGEDCDDTNPLVYPGATENPSNTADDDCDGIIDEQIVITGVSPSNGIQGGGTLVTVTGHAFNGVAAATVGGTAPTALSVIDDGTIELVTAPGTLGDVDVSVSHAFDTDTSVDAFRYTGAVTNIDQATLPAAVEQTTNPGTPSAPYLGTVTDSGVTDAAGQGIGIVAEIGLGMQGWDPTNAPDSYSWSAASFDADDGDGDRYTGTITPETYGSYVVTFRFSDDGGYNWIYADSDAGTALDPIEMSVLHVIP